MSRLFRPARVRIYEEEAKNADTRSTFMKPEDFARPQSQEDQKENRKPGWKPRKRGKESKDNLVVEQELRENHAARKDDMLERHLRDKREAAGRSLTQVVASGSDRHKRGQTPSSNVYGQIAPQIYRDESECGLISKRGTVRYELPAEEEPRPRQPDGVPMRPQRYDCPYYGIEYGRQPGWTLHYGRFQPSTPCENLPGQDAVAGRGSVGYELQGDMPAAHLSTVTTRGPYGLPVSHQTSYSDQAPRYKASEGQSWI
ncbi:hypothetical protein N0V82_007572 [Gnomoniopsis sp. IMI 355080]|nr:hypothetical protein N0V82_007572 [Gnomoniopsis sp. IMI 355080]